MHKENYYPRPPQHDTAVKRAVEKCPESVTAIDAILMSADEQAYKNLTLYESPEFSGLKIPVTKFSFTITPKEKDNMPKPQSILEINLGGFEVAQNGLNQENYYNRIFAYTEEVKQTGIPIEHTIFFVGQSTSLGGKTTKEFYEAKKAHGLAIEGRVIASFAEKTTQSNQKENMKLVFYGKSMGAIKALEAAQQFIPSEIEKMAELVNPPRIPGLSKEYQPSNLHIILGYALQSSFDKNIKKIVKEVIRKEYSQELQEVFEAKDISTKDSLQQQLLKTKVVLSNIPNILGNTIHQQEQFNFPIHVQVGALDPINCSLRGFLQGRSKETITNGNINVDYVMDNHSPNPYPVTLWDKALKGVDIQQL